MLNYLVCLLVALSPIIFSHRFGSPIRSVPKQFVLIAALVQSSMSSFAGSVADSVEVMEIDQEYPGTAVQRMQAIRQRVRSLTPEQLNGDWESVRRSLLWAGGLRDLTSVAPGMGYTGHSFNDFNHCDLTAMRDEVAEAEHNGEIEGIGPRNALGTFTMALLIVLVSISRKCFGCRVLVAKISCILWLLGSTYPLIGC